MKSKGIEKKWLIVLPGLFLVILPCIGQAQIPQKINYQGYLTSAAGVPVNGTVAMVFSFYTAPTGGSPIWNETQNVTVHNGVYNVNLGEVAPISLPFAIPYYLGVAVGTDPEMTPRIPFTSVGYAFHAAVAEHVHGSGGSMQASSAGSILYIWNSYPQDGDGLQVGTSSSYGKAIRAQANGDGPAYGVWAWAESTGDFENHGGYFRASGGKGQGIHGSADNNGDVTNYGGYFEAQGNYGRGVYGCANNTSGDTINYGGYFEAKGGQGMGVYGLASNTGSTNNFGGYFEAKGGQGRGVYGKGNEGGRFETDGSTGTGVIGIAFNSSDSENYGGYFAANGAYGRGVRGIASHGGDVTNFGGYFQSSGNMGYGVYGLASGFTGRAVYGRASSTGDVRNYGGYFEALGNKGYGVYGTAPGILGVGVVGETSGQNGIGVYGSATYGGDFNFGGYFVSNGFGGYGIFAKGPQTGHAAGFQGKVLITSWETNTPVIELGEGLDYAEGFNVSDKNMIEPGSVLVIDSDNTGKLRLSDRPFDSKVAGIVAGARGLGSGVRLGAGQYDYDVALAGRVYCYVDATEAGVEPGDLLTTSSTPGHAMKATDHIRAQGAILGKAMQKIEKGQKGQILVLVTLQ